MTTKEESKMNKKIETETRIKYSVSNDFDYLMSKINMGASFLDSKAITILNNLSKRIKELEENQKR